jgi:hypothetical protein
MLAGLVFSAKIMGIVCKGLYPVYVQLSVGAGTGYQGT